MKQHQYEFKITHLCDQDGHPSEYSEPLIFKTGNHDDLFTIPGLTKNRNDLSTADATALTIGLKLFSEVMLEHRGHPLFQDFQPHLVNFMKLLKTSGKADIESELSGHIERVHS